MSPKTTKIERINLPAGIPSPTSNMGETKFKFQAENTKNRKLSQDPYSVK